MMERYRFEVAETSFAVVLPEKIGKRIIERQYSPFEVPEDGTEPHFTLTVETVQGLEDRDFGELLEIYNEEPPFLWLYKKGEEYNVGFSLTKKHPAGMLNGDRLWLREDEDRSTQECCINNALMMKYTEACSHRSSLMVHASVTMYESGGYAFLGKSGTGKSTHSSLWLKNIEGTELLNDDNPVIHMKDGIPYVYGTPWSGKTPCYKNRHVPLKAIVRIVRAQENRATRLDVVRSFASFMPSCSNLRWDRESSEDCMKTVGQVIAACPCWTMECLPDDDAALVCSRAVAGRK